MKIYFAPLQGYTDAAYRRIHNEIYGGCIECYYSPFIRVEKGEIRKKDLHDISPENNVGINLVPQIIVNSVSEFNCLVDRISDMGYLQIDINMGCPFPLQTRKGRGAGLLPRQNIVSEIFEAVRSRDNIGFSVKMRLGMDVAAESVSLVPIINDTPLRHIVVHPRVGKQQYKGIPDIESFNELSQKIHHPIVYNGDILSVGDIVKLQQEYQNIHGVMIGRGLLARPSLALEYKSGESISRERRIILLMKMHDALMEYYSVVLQGDSQLLLKMKTFWDYLEPEIGHKAFKLLKKSSSVAKYNVALSQVIYGD